MSDPNISIPITSEHPAGTEADSMEGVEQDAPTIDDNADAAVDVDPELEAAAQELEEEMEITELRPTFVDYLKSPVITISIGTPPVETSLSAHLMLLQTSPFLTRECANFTSDTPPNERVIHLPDEDLNAVGALLEYLYTAEYRPRLLPGPSGKPDDKILEEMLESAEVDDDGDQLLRHARVYTLGGKLELPALKELAHSKIHRINSTAKGELRYAKYVYKHTSREDKVIRAPIASFWAHRSHVLRHEAEEDFRSMILEFPMFAYDILSIVLDQKEKIKEKRGTIEIDPLQSHVPLTPAEKAPRTGRKRPRTSTVM